MYDKAIKDDPGFAVAYAKRSIARSWGYHTGQLDTSQFAPCKADAEMAFAIDKGLAGAQVRRLFGSTTITAEVIEAITIFAASEMDPSDYQPTFYMAMVFRKMGEWKQSQALIRKVIEKEPQDALILINIGSSFTYMHSFDTADLFFYQKATEVMPSWSGPYISMIECLILKNGNTKEARKVLDTMFVQNRYQRPLLGCYDEHL